MYSVMLRRSVVLLIGLNAVVASLGPRRQASVWDVQAKSASKALDWLVENQLGDCSFAILATDDSFSADVTLRLVDLMVERGLLYQVSVMAFGGPGWKPLWRATNCDTYIVIAQDLLMLKDFLDADEDAWDWQGRYVFLSQSSKSDLQRIAVMYKLQKTVDVLFFVPGRTENELTLYTHQLYTEETIKFLNVWRDGEPVTLVDVFPDKLRDLKGQELRVFTFNHAPSVFSDVDQDGFLHNVSGIDIRVVQAIGRTLNFKPVFEHPGPARWGTILPNGTHTGMVGRINNDEAEMGVGNVFVTEVRARYITFSIPYDYERACFLTPSPRELPRWMALTFPFTLYVWVLLIVTVASLVVFVPLFGKVMLLEEFAGDLNTLSGTFLYITALFCNQATILPSRTPMQVMAAFLIISGFLTTVFYSSNLKAFMMVKVVEQPYTSIRQIVESDYEVGGFSDFWRAIFDESSNENVKKLGQKFFSFFPDISPHLTRVASRKVVLLENTQHLTYLQESYLTNRIGESPVRLMLEECINPFGIGALLRRNSPLKHNVDMAILRMREAGLVDKYFEEVLLKGHSEDHNIDNVEYNNEESAIGQGVIALTLEHLQGAFLVFGLGLFAALCVMLTEAATALCTCMDPLQPKA